MRREEMIARFKEESAKHKDVKEKILRKAILRTLRYLLFDHLSLIFLTILFFVALKNKALFWELGLLCVAFKVGSVVGFTRGVLYCRKNKNYMEKP
jgi:hypothetical protein